MIWEELAIPTYAKQALYGPSTSSEDNLVNKSSDARESLRTMGGSACCLIFGRPQSEEQTTTCGKDLESSECVDTRHPPRKIVDRRCDRTFTVASQRPALICETIVTIVTENEMVEQPDAP
jgi:hypothetical protein